MAASFLKRSVMLSYAKIISRAYHSALHYPQLWFFGLFVVGAFNLNFLHFQNLPLRRLLQTGRPQEFAWYFQSHPGVLAAASAAVLLFAFVALVVTNWSRLMLIVLGQAALEGKPLQIIKAARESLLGLGVFIKISLLTSGFMLFAAMALFVPAYWLPIAESFRVYLIEVGVLIFLPLAFTVSCINIFTSFYAVLYRLGLGKALNLGTDFFASRWSQILGLVAILIVIYLAGFIAGVALIFITREIFQLIFEVFLRFHILPLSAIIFMLKLVSGTLFWFLLSGLSVFFNQALLVLFLELSKPLNAAEAQKSQVVVPAATV